MKKKEIIQKERKTMEKKMIIEGMKCNHCKMTVEKALKNVEGVEEATVDLESKTAHIQLGAEVTDQALMEAVAAKNFIPVKVMAV